MTFNADTYKRMELQLSGIDREIERTDQLLKPYEKIFKSLDTSLYQSIGRTAAQAINQASPALQVAEGIKNFATIGSLAQPNNLQVDATRAFGVKLRHLTASVATQHVGVLEGLPKHMACLSSGLVSSIASDMAAARLRPLHTFTASVVAAGVHQEVTTNAWRSSLMHSTTDIMRSLDDFASLQSKPMLDLLRAYQAPGIRILDRWQQYELHQAARTATQVSSALAPLSGLMRESRLREVRAAPLTSAGIVTTSPPVEPEIRSVAGVEDVDEANKVELQGTWRIIASVEGWLQDIKDGPLTVRLLFMGLGQIVMAVIAGGIVYLFFYY